MEIEKKNIYIILTCLVSIILLTFDLFDSEFSFHDILVESHGLLFDLIIFGIILTIYEKRIDNRKEIEYYKELLLDLRTWKDRINGEKVFRILKKLDKLGSTKLTLTESYLNFNFDFSDFKNLKGCSFTACNLINSKFSNLNMTESTFVLTRLDNSEFSNINFLNSRISSCNMKNTKFKNVNFKNVVFTGSILCNTEFINCDFTNADFENTIVNEEDIFNILSKNGNKGINNRKYVVEKNEISFNGVTQNKIIKKKLPTT